jgi:hypothetical protein
MPPQAWICPRYHTQMGLARQGTATSRVANTIRSLLFCRSSRWSLTERAHHVDQIPAYFGFAEALGRKFDGILFGSISIFRWNGRKRIRTLRILRFCVALLGKAYCDAQEEDRTEKKNNIPHTPPPDRGNTDGAMSGSLEVQFTAVKREVEVTTTQSSL